MSTHALEARVGFSTHMPEAARKQLPWMLGGLLGGFLVPFVLADQLETPTDLYYGIYGVLVIGFLASWARATGLRWREAVRRRMRLTILLAVGCSMVLTFIVIGQGATSRPAGAALIGAMLWRGVFYGAIDGLLLSSFPILVTFAAFKGSGLDRHGRRGKVAIGAVALVASLLMTAVYHVGYSDFRSGKVKSPLAGDVVWSVPTLVTLNPIGAPIAHIVLHTTAVMHAYHADLFLPPHR
jgi:hypothetical protein